MNRYENQALYIAGPACFYPRGYDLWEALRRQAVYYGFQVALPNDNKLKLDHEDLQKNADAIFANCAESMNRSTAILADLELFRGAEPDGGSIYEIGMAYARGLRCYAYTRDKRPLTHKYQQAYLKDGQAFDQDGRPLPYGDLPFSPSVVASCKIVEGSFVDCLKTLATDLDEEAKAAWNKTAAKEEAPEAPKTSGCPRVYLADVRRYDADGAQQYAHLKEVCRQHGLEAVTPLDGTEDIHFDDPYTQAAALFAQWQKNLRSCDLVLADLSDFHGLEPSADVAFECGCGWQLGKRCFGYMKDARIMQQRIPHYGPERENADLCGNVVEDFNYPINLMFASSMPIRQASAEEAIAWAAEAYFAKNDR